MWRFWRWRMFRWSDELTREGWKFVLTVLQALAIVGGAGYAVFQFREHLSEQKIATDQQHEAVLRELRKPFDEKQLQFYAEAARVVAHLAVVIDDGKAEEDGTLGKFWELYWGQLPLVESSNFKSEMATFCSKRFANSAPNIRARCGDTPNEKTTGDRGLTEAIKVAITAKTEICRRWAVKEECP
jgi:hypothetical protein